MSYTLVWCNGNAFDLINVVTLRRARLVPRWVTVMRVYHHSIGRLNVKKVGSKQAYRVIH